MSKNNVQEPRLENEYLDEILSITENIANISDDRLSLANTYNEYVDARNQWVKLTQDKTNAKAAWEKKIKDTKELPDVAHAYAEIEAERKAMKGWPKNDPCFLALAHQEKLIDDVVKRRCADLHKAYRTAVYEYDQHTNYMRSDELAEIKAVFDRLGGAK